MRTFKFTSDNVTGEIVITYNDREITIDANAAEIDDMQLSYLGRAVFANAINPDHLTSIVEGSKFNAKIIEIVKDYTFQEFWDRYFKDRYKDNSSKKRAEALWNKLSKVKKSDAYNYIPKYFGNIRPGVEIKLAETYLSQEIWVK